MSKLIAGIVCALVISVPSLAVGPQVDRDLTHRIHVLEEQAQTYLQKQEPRLAIPVLREIILLDPKNLNAHANLGVLLFFQSNYSEAIPQMRSALQLQPDLWKIKALLGIAEKRTGDPSQAQSDLEQAFPNLDDKKIRKETGLELIELDSSLGHFARALSVTERLEELSPEDLQILFAAYEISSQMTNQSLLSMILVAPDSAEMHMIMAGELGRQGDHVNAIAQYREVIRLNPMLPGVHMELAEQLMSSLDPVLNAQAEGEFKAAIQANQYDEKAWCRLGDLMAAKGDFKTAQDDYKRALALQPRDSNAKTNLAIALISMKQTSEAISLLESAVKDDPTNVVAHYRLSALYRQAGRMVDSQREMEIFLHYNDVKEKLGKIFWQVRVPTISK